MTTSPARATRSWSGSATARCRATARGTTRGSPCSSSGSTEGKPPEAAHTLLLVTLDDLGRPELRALGALAGLSARAPLPQEIPALVERHAQRLQPLPVGVGRLPCRFSLPELVLLGDHPVDRTVDLGVWHF